MPWAPSQTLAGTLGFIRESRARADAGEGLVLAIVCAGRIAGTVGANAIDRPNRSASLGYWLVEDHHGRGIVTEGTAALVDHAIDAWDLNRIEIRAARENHRSRAIPERLGFSY